MPTKHRRPGKARTRGPTKQNPEHRREVPPDTVNADAGVEFPPGNPPCDAGKREDTG